MLLLHRLSHPDSGALEVLKLAALVAMVVDHVNKYALDRAYPVAEHVGRLSFPLFALVVAANLRWNTADPQRYFVRLAVWGMGSQAVYTWATGHTDLNILLTLGIGVQFVLAVEALRQQVSAVGVLWLAVVIGASLACDYRLTGPLLVVLVYEWFARPGLITALLVVLGVAAQWLAALRAGGAGVARRGGCGGMVGAARAAAHPSLVLSVLPGPPGVDSLAGLAAALVVALARLVADHAAGHGG